MERKILWIYVAIAITVLAIAGVLLYPMSSSVKQTTLNQKVNVTEENFPSYLASTNIVSDLPADALILLKTEKQSYVVQKGSVTPGTIANPDIVITIPSKYIPQISNGFCSTMQAAYKAGDLGVQLNMNKFSAALKYSSLLKYKSCLGI